MNGYLKINSELPEGPSYKDFSLYELPRTVLNLPDLTSLFNFKSGLDTYVGQSTVYGEPIKEVEGYRFNGEYIDTHVTTEEEFTWIVLYRNKEEPTSAYYGLVNNFKLFGGSGEYAGSIMGVKYDHIQHEEGVRSTAQFLYDTPSFDEWKLAIHSRKVNEDGTFTYSRIFKSLSKGWQEWEATNAAPVPNVPATKTTEIGLIGYVDDTGGLVFNFAATTSKGYTPTEIKSIAENIVEDLNTNGYPL